MQEVCRHLRCRLQSSECESQDSVFSKTKFFPPNHCLLFSPYAYNLSTSPKYKHFKDSQWLFVGFFKPSSLVPWVQGDALGSPLENGALLKPEHLHFYLCSTLVELHSREEFPAENERLKTLIQ